MQRPLGEDLLIFIFKILKNLVEEGGPAKIVKFMGQVVDGFGVQMGLFWSYRTNALIFFKKNLILFSFTCHLTRKLIRWLSKYLPKKCI